MIWEVVLACIFHVRSRPWSKVGLPLKAELPLVACRRRFLVKVRDDQQQCTKEEQSLRCFVYEGPL